MKREDKSDRGDDLRCNSQFGQTRVAGYSEGRADLALVPDNSQWRDSPRRRNFPPRWMNRPGKELGSKLTANDNREWADGRTDGASFRSRRAKESDERGLVPGVFY